MQFSISTNASEVTAKLRSIPALVDTDLFDAIGRSLDEMESYAVSYNYATFMNPTGELEGNYEEIVERIGGGVKGTLSNPTAWAWRQEEGFSGMTDSLGRFFPYTPAYHYMQHTVEDMAPTVLGLISDSIGQTLGGL